jgi:hypothetical protein
MVLVSLNTSGSKKKLKENNNKWTQIVLKSISQLFVLRQGLTTLPQLVLKSWAHVTFLSHPPKRLETTGVYHWAWI